MERNDVGSTYAAPSTVSVSISLQSSGSSVASHVTAFLQASRRAQVPAGKRRQRETAGTLILPFRDFCCSREEMQFFREVDD